jgi:tetratricopeptide (TPR) repeat protein
LTRAIEAAGQIPSSSIYSDDAKWQSAVALNRMGTLMIGIAGRRDESTKRFESAFAILEALAKSFPAITVYREELAVSESGRARSYMLANRLSEAEMVLGQALGHLNELLKSAPANPQYLGLLGEATAIAAEVSKKAGKTGEQRRRIAEAIKAFDQAVNIDPDRQTDQDALTRLKAERSTIPR